jgi:hypothetical protein
MKSLIPIFALLFTVVACNPKSDEPEVLADRYEESPQKQVHKEIPQEIQQKSQTWDKEPISVFGIPFSTSKKEVAKRFELYSCNKSRIMEICHFNHKLSDVNLRCTIAFSEKSGMQHVRAVFSEYDRESLLSILSKAYGRPHFTVPDAEDPAKIWGHDWRGENVNVSFIGESFSITTKRFLKEIEESKKSKINSAAKEL